MKRSDRRNRQNTQPLPANPTTRYTEGIIKGVDCDPDDCNHDLIRGILIDDLLRSDGPYCHAYFMRPPQMRRGMRTNRRGTDT